MIVPPLSFILCFAVIGSIIGLCAMAKCELEMFQPALTSELTGEDQPQ